MCVCVCVGGGGGFRSHWVNLTKLVKQWFPWKPLTGLQVVKCRQFMNKGCVMNLFILSLSKEDFGAVVAQMASVRLSEQEVPGSIPGDFNVCFDFPLIRVAIALNPVKTEH